MFTHPRSTIAQLAESAGLSLDERDLDTLVAYYGANRPELEQAFQLIGADDSPMSPGA